MYLSLPPSRGGRGGSPYDGGIRNGSLWWMEELLEGRMVYVVDDAVELPEMAVATRGHGGPSSVEEEKGW